MATNEEVEAAKEQRDDIVIVDGIRYRKKDADALTGKGGETDAPADAADTEKKARTTAANKARTSGEGDKG